MHTHDGLITNSHVSRPLLLCIAVLLSVGVVSFFSVSPRAIVATTSSWSGPDFTYCATYLKGWWDGAISNPFDYNEQLLLFQRLYGYRGDIIMPVAWSPWSVLLLYPLLRLSTDASAAAAWTTLSFGFFLTSIVVWVTRATNSTQELIFRTAVGVSLITSLASMQTLDLAQLSFLGAGCLSLILMLSAFPPRAQIPLAALCVSALSIKPTYALLAVCILIVERRWKALIASVGSVAILASVTAAILPIEAWSDWLYQLRLHSHPTDRRYLSPGTVHGYLQSAVVGNALAMWLPDILIHRISNALFVAILAFILAIASCSSRIPRAPLCCSLIACFFVALPYLGAHDELLLFPLLVSAWPGILRIREMGLVVVAGTIITLLPYPLPPSVRLAIKAILATTLLWSSIKPKNAS